MIFLVLGFIVLSLTITKWGQRKKWTLISITVALYLAGVFIAIRAENELACAIKNQPFIVLSFPSNGE
jgi:hypothetical protein